MKNLHAICISLFACGLVLCVSHSIAEEPAAPAAPPKEYRSKITDGSYSLDASGNMRMEYAFEGEEPIIDSKVTMTQLSENEFQIGGNEVVIFVDGKLARMRK